VCCWRKSLCIDVPTDRSVDEVLKKASEHSEVDGASLSYSDIPMNMCHLLTDYFEYEAVDRVGLAVDYLSIRRAVC
jgi:hypothetical protein